MSPAPWFISAPHRSLRPLRAASALAVLVIICALVAPEGAQAKSKAKHQQGATGSDQKKGVTKITYRASPSEETRAERERRLFRECRGMHDAGACKGFTRR